MEEGNYDISLWLCFFVTAFYARDRCLNYDGKRVVRYTRSCYCVYKIVVTFYTHICFSGYVLHAHLLISVYKRGYVIHRIHILFLRKQLFCALYHCVTCRVHPSSCSSHSVFRKHLNTRVFLFGKENLWNVLNLLLYEWETDGTEEVLLPGYVENPDRSNG